MLRRHGEDEVVVTAYCGTKRAAPNYLNERAVSCGINPDVSGGPLVMVCAKKRIKVRRLSK